MIESIRLEDSNQDSAPLNSIMKFERLIEGDSGLETLERWNLDFGGVGDLLCANSTAACATFLVDQL